MESIMYQTINIAPTIPGRVRGDVPQLVDLVVARMLDKAPDHRYQTAKELADDLRECLRTLDVASLSATGSTLLAATTPDLVRLADEKRSEAPPPAVDGDSDGAGDETLPMPFMPGGSVPGGATLLLSREFDSNAATEKLVQGLSSPFDSPPPGQILGATEVRFDPAMTLDERGLPGAATVVMPIASDEKASSAWLPLSQREKQVSVGILGAAALLSAALLLV